VPRLLGAIALKAILNSCQLQAPPPLVKKLDIKLLFDAPYPMPVFEQAPRWGFFLVPAMYPPV